MLKTLDADIERTCKTFEESFEVCFKSNLGEAYVMVSPSDSVEKRATEVTGWQSVEVYLGDDLITGTFEENRICADAKLTVKNAIDEQILAHIRDPNKPKGSYDGYTKARIKPDWEDGMFETRMALVEETGKYHPGKPAIRDNGSCWHYWQWSCCKVQVNRRGSADLGNYQQLMVVCQLERVCYVTDTVTLQIPGCREVSDGHTDEPSIFVSS